jgi:hypothetical protein
MSILVRSGDLKTSSLSGVSGGCALAGRSPTGQLIDGMRVTVVVRSAPCAAVRCGTRVARPSRVRASGVPGGSRAFSGRATVAVDYAVLV